MWIFFKPKLWVLSSLWFTPATSLENTLRLISEFLFCIWFITLLHFLSNEVEMWMLICVKFSFCAATHTLSLHSLWYPPPPASPGLSLLKGKSPERLSPWPWFRRGIPISILNAFPSLILYYDTEILASFFSFTLNPFSVTNFIARKYTSAQEYWEHIWEKTLHN